MSSVLFEPLALPGTSTDVSRIPRSPSVAELSKLNIPVFGGPSMGAMQAYSAGPEMEIYVESSPLTSGIGKVASQLQEKLKPNANISDLELPRYRDELDLMPMPVLALEFYSGIGGLHRALERSNIAGSIVRAFDWDQTACQVYAANYGADLVKKVDISTLTASSLAHLGADLWLLSPSCQPYTIINPLAKGAADPRAKSFIHLIQSVLPNLVASKGHPRYLLVENVAGFETSDTRQLLVSILKTLGYTTVEFLLTPLQFQIPNSRLRYYLLAKMAPLIFPCLPNPSEDKFWRYIPGCGFDRDWIDPRSCNEPDTNSPVEHLWPYLDDCVVEVQSHPHRVPDRILAKWGRLFDIVLPSAQRTCCFTRAGYTQLVEKSGSILQMNEKLDTKAIFDQFLEAQDQGEADAVRILFPLQLRYFTPTELLRLLSFESARKTDTFLWPPYITTKTKYRLIGNSVNVKVVTELINFLFV